MMTGTLNMQDLAARLPEVSDTRTVRAGFAFLTVGIGLKLALFPLHLWLPNAYAYAPSAVTAFLAATATKVAVYVLLRFMLDVFGVEFSLASHAIRPDPDGAGPAGHPQLPRWSRSFSTTSSACSPIPASRRSATWCWASASPRRPASAAAILHVFNHALMKGALFLALGAVAYRIGAVTMRDFAGLGRRMPWTMAAIALGGLSLIGVPPTAGFVSKWYLVLGDPGAGPVAGRRADPGRFAAGAGLRLATDRGRLLPARLPRIRRRSARHRHRC